MPLTLPLAAFTVIFWRASPAGIVALAALCGGDGMADVCGRRWGAKMGGGLPYNRQKVGRGGEADE